MKSGKLLSLIMPLLMAVALTTTQLFAQREGGGEGKGGQGKGAQGQRPGGQNNMQNLSPEERMKKINEMIQAEVIKMAEAAEIREDQQQAFVKAQANYEVETVKLRSQMQSAGQDRDKRTKLRNAMMKLGTTTEKAMKGILDKDQMKAYQAAMKKRQPQGGPRGGGGGGGGGQRGGGGGGGDN